VLADFSFFLTVQFASPHVSVSPRRRSRSGELDLSGVQWQASKHFLLLALAYLKRMFYKPELWEVAKPFNLEAFRMCVVFMLLSV
jgi:hypothetical protein